MDATKELTYASYEPEMWLAWEAIYERDAKLLSENKPPLAIKSLLIFKKRHLATEADSEGRTLLYNDFYCKQKLSNPQIPLKMVLPLFLPYDPLSWNFTKAPQAQRIGKLGPHLLLASICPLAKYHCILVPFYESSLPQQIRNIDELQVPLEMLRNSKQLDAKILFNGFRAGASVNHLHFQLIYAKDLLDNTHLPIERCLQSDNVCLLKVLDNDLIVLQENVKYVLPYFKLAVHNETTLHDHLALCLTIVYKLVKAISDAQCAVNILMSDQGRSVFVIPRKPQEVILPLPLGDGVMECCGVSLCFSEETFAICSKEYYNEHIKQYAVALDTFAHIKAIASSELAPLVSHHPSSA